jgi:Na+/proline symporter
MADSTAARLAALDWAILAAYLVTCIGIGWWAMRKVTDAGGYLLARRQLGKVMSLAATFSGGVNASDPVTVSSKVYTQGVSGIWVALNFLLLTPWFWMRDAVGRRLRLVTATDVMELRFGQTTKWVFLATTVILSVVGLGLGIKTAAMVTVGVAGGAGNLALFNITGNVERDVMILATGLVVIPTMIYTIMGGILAACATDVFMSVLIIVLSFAVIPFAWHAVGGLEALRQGLPAGHIELISATAVNDFTIWGIIWFMIFWVIGLTPTPSAARDEMTARIGSLGLLFKRFCTLGWAVLGLIGVLLYANVHGLSATAGDQVFARMSVELLPNGLRGVMVAAILAAAMSTIASMALFFAGNILNNVWRPLIAPTASPAHYLLMARVLTAVVLLAAWLVAVQSQTDIFTFYTHLASLGAILGLATLAAYLWRRVTAAGALASAAVMLPPVAATIFGGNLSEAWGPGWDWARPLWVGWLECVQAGYHACGVDTVRLITNADGVISSAPLAIRFPAQLLPGLAALIGVSLLTRQHNDRHVHEFYARLDTPVGEEQRLVDQGIQVDLLQGLGSDAEVTTRDPSRRLLFLDLLYLPWLLARGEARWSDYRVDLWGILGTSLFVAVFISGLLWLVGWLRPVA